MIRAIVLAAGKGMRMKSTRTKVLHEICGRPMLWYVLESLRRSGMDEIVVVVNEQLNAEMGQFGVPAIVQREQRGTGDAVRAALERLDAASNGRVIVTCGDMPLVPPELFACVLQPLEDNDVVMSLITAKMPLPSSFGRVVRNGARVERIVEVSDAAPEQLAIDEMNAGVYAFDEAALREAVNDLRNDNAQGEYYLTDVVAYFGHAGKGVKAVTASDHRHVLGINDRAELALARQEMNARLCAQHMSDGVTIVDPATTYLEPELRIGRDTVIYPNTTISRLSQLGAHCTIGPNSRLSNSRLGARVTVRESVISDSTVGDDTSIGPFAHLRGDAVLAQRVHVGNFVEIKKSSLGDRVKAGHLSYLGDATIGDGSNVGAGTITCNFDGERKNATTVGRDVAIGSNTSLVAPVNLGDGSLTGAGAVVTHDVPAGERVAGNPARPLPKK